MKIHETVMNMPAVDAHEHLLPESQRLQTDVDVLYLFRQYAISDMLSAGMPAADAARIHSGDGPLETRWKIFQPYLRYIRHTGASRAVFIALRDIYGIDRLDATNYQAASERVRAENTSGITDRCLGQRARIIAILNCNYQFEQPVPYARGIMPVPSIPKDNTADFLQTAGKALQIKAIDNPEQLEAWVNSLMKDYRRNKIIGLKMVARECQPVQPSSAEKILLQALGRNHLDDAAWRALNDYLLETALRLAPRHDLTIAVHTGVLAQANTCFRGSHVRHLVPLLLRHPDTRFDIFHLNYPWTDEAIGIAQKFSNAYLNLTWLPVLNPEVARRVMREIMYAVPANKVLAMGGDYWRLPDVAYGHLLLARQLLSQAFTDAMDEGRLDFSSAADIAQLWLRENAFTTYPLANRTAS